MGIRVNKVIGYGVKDFTPSRTTTKLINKFGETKFADVLKYIEKHREEILTLADTRPGISHAGLTKAKAIKVARRMNEFDLRFIGERKVPFHGRHIATEKESDIPHALVFVPLNKPDWIRHDDTIDYIEEHVILMTANEGGYSVSEPTPRDRYTPTSLALYPYNKSGPPASVAAMCHFIKRPDLYARLEEAVAVWWH